MSGIPFFNAKAICDAEIRARFHGLDVISPVRLDQEAGMNAFALPEERDWNVLPGDWLPYDVIMARDLRELAKCQAIALGPNWEQSKGCNIEIAKALELGLEFLDAKDFSPITVHPKPKHLTATTEPSKSLKVNAGEVKGAASVVTRGNNMRTFKGSKTDPDDSILEIAYRLTRGDRNSDYGEPWIDRQKIASFWSVYLGVPIRADQVAIMMVMLKVARLGHSPAHKDSLIDIAGYADCAMRIIEHAKESKP